MLSSLFTSRSLYITIYNIKIVFSFFCRVAVLVIGFHDCLVGSTDLSGLTGLCVRLLTANNYKTLLIRHDEFKPHHKKIERVKILEQKLKDLLAVKSAWRRNNERQFKKMFNRVTGHQRCCYQLAIIMNLFMDSVFYLIQGICASFLNKFVFHNTFAVFSLWFSF